MTVPVLDTDTVPAYIASRPDLAALVDTTTLSVVEIGDGNLNLVFVATDAARASITLKQSLPYVRMIGESWPLSQDRILSEAAAYDQSALLSPGTTVPYHGLDAENRVIALEDMSTWTVWRTALNDGRISEGAADAVGRHVARLAFGTSVFGLDPGEHKRRIAASVNPEMCRITEDVVFTEPFLDHEHNWRDEELEPDALALRDGLLDHVSALKHVFMTKSEALIHGDLHTGSIFVPPAGGAAPGGPARVFDIEFAYYGPVGFDLGAFFANAVIAQTRATVLDAAPDFRAWVSQLVTETWAGFEAELRSLWPSRVDQSFTDGFLDAWLRETFAEAVGFAGVKIVRRMVGLAHVSDIQSLEPADRIRASRALLGLARQFIEQRDAIDGVDELVALTASGLASLAPAGAGAGSGSASGSAADAAVGGAQ